MCRISFVPFLNNITSTDVNTIFKPDGEMFAIQLQTEDHRDGDLIATQVNMIRTQSYFNKMGKSVNVNNTDWPRSVSWPCSSELLRTLPVNRTSKIFKIDRESRARAPPRLFHNNWYFAFGSFISCHHFPTLLVQHRPHDLRIVSSLAICFAQEDITIPLN